MLSHLMATESSQDPLAPKAPHFAANAKRVIFLFMTGGVSHVDTFDPKPKLTEMDGKPLPFKTPLQFAATGNLFPDPAGYLTPGVPAAAIRGLASAATT